MTIQPISCVEAPRVTIPGIVVSFPAGKLSIAYLY
jgi:hypothetical protein